MGDDIITNFQFENCAIDLVKNNSGLVVRINGVIEMQNSYLTLQPILTKIHNYIIANKIASIMVDFTKCSYINSSGIRAFANWILLQNIPNNPHKYIFNIVHDKDINWQTTSLSTLTYLLPGLVNLI